MGKLQLDAEAVALKPIKKTMTVAEKRQIESEVPRKMTRAEAKEKKELEEARKDGTAMPEMDEKGEMINPHIPNYIASVPWYIDKDKKPSLFHQHKLKAEDKHGIGDWYHRGVPKNAKSANRYRKGACENCGAMTHKRRDCLERPRKKGAKWTGDDIAPDEFLQPSLELGFEGKRDRWNGYDPARHRFEVFEEFTKVDIARKAINAQRLQDEIESGTIENPDITDIVNGDKYEDGEVSMGGSAADSKQTVSVRNLRIREDTAKYLRNLDADSAYYDPKTRSMRENPYEQTGKAEDDVPFAGENFVRHTGESQEFAKSQVFAWDAMDKGVDVHAQANPTQLEYLRKSYRKKKEKHTESLKTNVIDKYGGLEHLKAPPKELLLAQTENYVEYSRTGQVIKGQERATVKSRYEEDVHPGNHSSVWGSYWEGGRWGYACCQSTIRGSYCIKTKEKEAIERSDTTPSALVPQVVKSEKKDEVEETSEEKEDEYAGLSLMEIHKKKMEKEQNKSDDKELSKKERKKLEKAERKKLRREAKEEKEKKEAEIEEAIRKEEERIKQVDAMMNTDERKRKYNSMAACNEPTEAEIEAWKRKKVNTADPMAAFLSK